jgi:lipase
MARDDTRIGALAARETYVDANGLRFHALEWPGRGPTVLLVHATSFCAAAWRPTWEAARTAGAAERHALAVDQRGHGGSAAPHAASAYAWTRLRDDVVALVEALGDRVIAVGHSSGATAVLAAAGTAPDRFAAVAAIEPVLVPLPGTGAPGDSFAGSQGLAAAARRRRDRFPSVAEARRRLAERFPYTGFGPGVLDAVLEGGLAPDVDGGVALCCPGEREALCYEGAAALDLWPLAARLAAPVLLLLGEHSAVAPPLRERLCASLPAVRVETVARATHFAALERPAEVGQALARFVAEVAGAR